MMLSDFMELSTMDKTQLVQLCEALYALLQKRDVAITLQQIPAPAPFTNTFPFSPVFTPHLNTGEPMPTLPRVSCNSGNAVLVESKV